MSQPSPEPIPNTKQIELYAHCRQCYEQLPPGISMKEYSRLEIGWTKRGIQVWCQRHNCNIANIDFEGQKHPANLEP